MNKDRNCSIRDYVDRLAVTSVFYSLQGEGPYTGVPFIFLRMAGCNFGSKTEVCTFCDTDFAMSTCTWYTVGDLLRELEEAATRRGCFNLLITGGEPTLQLLLIQVIKEWRMRHPTCIIQMETNGTQAKFWTEFEDIINYSVQVCCSPKCRESKVWVGIPKATQAVVTWYKYLLSANPNSPYHEVPVTEFNKDKPLFVSPITVYYKAPELIPNVFFSSSIDRVQTATNYAYAAKYVLSHPRYRLSLQTHLFIGVP
jgi:organic radical activating enzyme